MKHTLTILLALFGSFISAQTYTMSNSNVSTCSGTFYDSGGNGGNYGASQSYTMTFCPSTPGAKLTMNFTSFNTENSYDFLYVYDGNSTSAPSLGAYTGTTGPGSVQATATNTSGCITIRFTSDGSFNYAGWAATIGCTIPCETINSVLNSTSPAAGAGGIIRICQGQSVTFNGSGTFSSGSSAGATYSWNFGNGVTASGTSATATYTAAGVYAVNLTITKAGCTNNNKINQLVQVSTTPSFAGTTTSTTSICLGQSATLIGSVTPTPFIVNCTPPVAGTTFLPDGSGVSYNTCIPVNCFNSGQTVATANDIQNICLTMEHSYLGDLQIEIICPNGQTVPLKTYAQGGGGTYLGNPIDNTTGGPGTGSQYCFSMSGTTQLVNGPTVSSGSPAGNSIAAGTYSPQSSFAGLIGCPLNGNWCIKVTDNLASDDGYIFGWDVNFASGLVPSNQSFTPTIVSQTWTGPASLTQTGNNAAITPTSTGTKCYTLTAVDNFGCSYTNQQCITVNNGPFAGVSNTLAVCNSAPSTNLFSLLGSGVSTTGTWSGPSALTGGNLGTFNPATNAAGNYTYTVPGTGSCPPATAVVTVTIRPNPSATLSFTNPSCGLSNGVIVINNTSSGGQTISSYASSSGAVSGQTVTGLAAGTHVVTLTNNFGCTFTVSATLTNSPPITDVVLTPNNIICGSGTGSITIGAVTGGTSPYTYNVNGGAYSATPPVTGLASGTYTIGVRDALGCTYSEPVTITVTSGPTGLTGTSTAAGCSMSNGSYTVTGVTGGSPTYSYSFDGGVYSTTSNISSLSSGTHTVSVKDGNNCTYSVTVNIPGTTGPSSITVTTSNASCGSANGSATISAVTGGSPTYSYSYDAGGYTTTNTISNLTAGTHTVTVKDANSCTLTVTYNISNTGSPTASITNSTNISCFGLTNGSFTITASGGTGPYTYTLSSPFQSNGTGIFSNLPAGPYNITVKDAVGCITTTSVTLTQPSAISLTPTAVPAKCFGTPTGTINVAGSGGTPTYSFNINGGAYQTSSSFTNQVSGIYNIGIKDANGCTQTQTVQVTQPTDLTINISTQNANCTAANGIASATVSGGTPGYTYSWTGGGGSSAITNSLVSGTYTLTITDANSCIKTGVATIGNTPGGTAAITASTNITCNGAANGNLTAGMTSGGTAPYTYSWNSTPTQTTSTATNLGPGTYTCTITDFYGCIAKASGTLTQPSPLTALMNSNNAKCYGTATGTISAAGSGGTPPYTYFWPALSSTLSTVPNVSIGSYSCNITDANNCTITQSISVTQPSSITLTSTITVATCNQANGSATITASGGTPGYSYLWSTGATTPTVSNLPASTPTIEVKDANNCIQTLAITIPNSTGPAISISSQTDVACYNGNTGAATATVTGGAPTYTYNWSGGQNTPTATNLTAGVYTVSVTDANGCIASTSVTINQPTQLTVNITPTQPKCFGGTDGYGSASALGGSSPYTYNWTSGGGTNNTSAPLGAGIYGLTVTDSKSCTAVASMTLTNPPAMVASITSSNVNCYNSCDGLAIGSTTNAIGITSYNWIGGPNPITSQTASNLCAGTYTLIATDQNSCTASAQVTITQPAQLTASISSSGSVTCNGGTNGFAVVSSTGGTPGYTYSWTGAAAANGNSANANNLPAGTYTVTITDTKSCSTTAQVTITEPAPLSTTLTTTDPKCNGTFDGTANIAYAGGAGTTHFLWQPSLQSGNNLNTVNNLGAGTHTVTITSNGSCPTTLTFTLTDPAALTAAVTATNSNCGQNNGRTCATTTGGTGTLNYLWSNGVNTLCNNNVLAGAYNFTVTDANGCTATGSGLVNDIAGPSVSILSSTNVKCYGGNDGTATTNITGGVGTYSITWTNGSTTQNVTNLNNGIHNITVTDGAGCIGTASVNITQPQAIASAITSFTDVSCNGLSNGGATMAVNFGTGPYTYTWTPSNQNTDILSNVPAGTYTCNVTDANGCTTSQSITITQPAPLVMTNSVVTNITCFGLNNGQIATTVNGGTPGYTYNWTPSQPGNSGVIGSLPTGTYVLTVTDTRTCSITTNFTVLEPSALTSTYTSLPAKCGIANGSATVTVNGGTPNYNLTWNTTTPQSGSVAINMAPGSNWNCTITDANGCSITQTININNAPSPVISSFSVTQPSCFGLQNGSIAINYTSGTPSYSVSWSSPISITQVTSTQSQTVSGIGSGAYTATVTDSYGCAASLPVVVAQPSLLVLTVGADPTICYGQSTQIYATGQNGTPAYSYTWSPNPFTGGGPHTVNPATTSTYTVSVSDANGCSPSPKVITVNVTPPLSISSYSAAECYGNTVLLAPNMTSAGNGGPYTYNWQPGAVSTSSLMATANNTATAVQYTLTVSDGCTIPTATAVFTVFTNPVPIISFTASPLKGCAPLTTTLTATSNGSNDVFTWEDNIHHSIGTGNPLIGTYADSGRYTISLHVFNPTTGCSSDLTKNNYITVYAKPIASFIPNPSSASILEPTIYFTNTSVGATNYYWDFGDPAAIAGTNTSILSNPNHSYGYTGTYNVHLVATSQYGCKDTAMHLVEILPDFVLYIPNTFTPDGNGVNDTFQPMGVGINEDNYKMEIFDRWGESIFTSDSFRKGWDGSVKGGKLAPQGVYVYKIQVIDTQGGKHPYVGHVTVIRTNQ